jgi:hypothetical protein
MTIIGTMQNGITARWKLQRFDWKIPVHLQDTSSLRAHFFVLRWWPLVRRLWRLFLTGRVYSVWGQCVYNMEAGVRGAMCEERMWMCVCVCCVLCIRSRSRSGRRAPGPRPRVTSPTITDGDEVQSPTDLKVTLPTDNNRSRIGESVGTDLDAHSTTERTPIRNVPDETNFFSKFRTIKFQFQS